MAIRDDQDHAGAPSCISRISRISRAGLREWLTRSIDGVRSSPWATLAVRATLLACALLVLGWIGRTATASPANASSPPGGGSESAAASAPARVADGARDGGVELASAIAHASANPPASVTSTTTPTASSAKASPAEPVILNTASVTDLRRLPGIGPKRAQAILALRDRLGRFHRIEDLLRVKGVGRNTVRKWRPLVRLDPPPLGPSRDPPPDSADGGAAAPM